MNDDAIPEHGHADQLVLRNGPRAEQLMRAAGVDALLATSTENVVYVSGFFTPTKLITKRSLLFALFTADGRSPVAVGPAFEADAWAQERPRSDEMRLYASPGSTEGGRVLGVPEDDLLPDERAIYERAFGGDVFGDAHAALRSALRDRGLDGARIALDDSGLSHRQRDALVEAFPDVEFSDGLDLLREIRRVKTPAEIARLARVNKIANRALAATMAVAEIGASERELIAHLNGVIVESGGMPTFAVISGGRHSGYPQGAPTDYRLRAGDTVKFDIGCSYGQYQADIGRTKVVGEPSDELARVYEALLVGQQSALAELKAGVRPSEIYAAAVDAVRAHGVPHYTRHHVGHGIGLEVYDPPLLQAAKPDDPHDDDRPLEAGEVLNVETPYYVLGSYGMIVEDAVVVLPDGFRYLATGLSRALA